MDTKSNPFEDSSSSQIERDGVRRSAKKRPRTYPPDIHAALRRLQQFAANTPPTGLTREQAAAIASREPHYLSYLFRREMGKTFTKWRREYRTSVAIAALEEGKRSIDEIVKLVGYRSRRSLERAVKDATGRTAGSYNRKRSNDSKVSDARSKESA